MQGTNGNLVGKCRCCLAEGNHQYHYDREMLRKCLNLLLLRDSRISMLMCGPCLSFLCDVQRFRKMVISSQKKLRAVFTSENKKQKKFTSVPSVNTAKTDHSIDFKDEIKVPKKEIESNPEDLSDWEAFENRGTDTSIKLEIDKSTAKVKRKRKTKSDKGELARKKVKTYDSESDTPISLIKEKKSLLKKELDREKKTSESKTPVSRKHTFTDNNRLRSNIILILKNSTILPFRNNFKSTFKCFYCDCSFIPFKELKGHMEVEHNTVSEATISKIVRSLHNIMVNADISRINCKLCEEEFKSIESLVDHLCKVHEKVYHATDKRPSHGILGMDLSTDALKCHLCNQEFAFFKNLSVHMNDHYGTFVCYICGKKFLSEHRYKCHEFKAHANKVTKCKHCGEVFKTEPAMAYHVRKQHLKGRIKCLKCPETFALGQYIKRLNHMAEVHGIEKPKFRCDTCNKDYSNSGSLAAHKRYTHKRVGELRCEICGYITVHKTVMQKHMDFHNGVRNYECEFCKKRFGKPYTLKLHLKIHLNDKKFVCTLCDAAFIQKNSLKSHLKSRHPDSGIDVSKL